MKAWLKERLRNWLFSDREKQEEEDFRKVYLGTSAEEKLEFWQQVHTALDSPGGVAYQALMQREFIRLQDRLLLGNTREDREETLFRLRQQVYVTTYPAHVRAQIAKFSKGPGDDPGNRR